MPILLREWFCLKEGRDNFKPHNDRDGGLVFCHDSLLNDEIQTDLILGDEELSWLAECWETATGRQLRKNPFQQLLSLLRQPPDEDGEG